MKKYITLRLTKTSKNFSGSSVIPLSFSEITRIIGAYVSNKLNAWGNIVIRSSPLLVGAIPVPLVRTFSWTRQRENK